MGEVESFRRCNDFRGDVDINPIGAALNRDDETAEPRATIVRGDPISVKLGIEGGQRKAWRIPVARAGLEDFELGLQKLLVPLAWPVAASAIEVAWMFAIMFIWND